MNNVMEDLNNLAGKGAALADGLVDGAMDIPAIPFQIGMDAIKMFGNKNINEEIDNRYIPALQSAKDDVLSTLLRLGGSESGAQWLDKHIDKNPKINNLAEYVRPSAKSVMALINRGGANDVLQPTLREEVVNQYWNLKNE